MKKVTFLIALFFITLFWGQNRSNWVAGVQLPFLYNNDREKPDENSGSKASISFNPRVNVYLQADISDSESVLLRKMLSSMRVDYTFVSAQQNDDYDKYNSIHQVSLLWIFLGNMQDTNGLQLGIGPNINFGDAQGVNARAFLGGYFQWKKIIFSADINYYIPNAKRKPNIPSDSYKYGHFSVGVGYRL